MVEKPPEISGFKLVKTESRIDLVRSKNSLKSKFLNKEIFTKIQNIEYTNNNRGLTDLDTLNRTLDTNQWMSNLQIDYFLDVAKKYALPKYNVFYNFGPLSFKNQSFRISQDSGTELICCSLINNNHFVTTKLSYETIGSEKTALIELADSLHYNQDTLSDKYLVDNLKSYFAVSQKEFANRCDQNRQQIVDQSDRNQGTQIRQKGEKAGWRKRGSWPQPLDVLGCHRRKPLCPHRQHCRVSNLTV